MKTTLRNALCAGAAIAALSTFGCRTIGTAGQSTGRAVGNTAEAAGDAAGTAARGAGGIIKDTADEADRELR